MAESSSAPVDTAFRTAMRQLGATVTMKSRFSQTSRQLGLTRQPHLAGTHHIRPTVDEVRAAMQVRHGSDHVTAPGNSKKRRGIGRQTMS